MSSSQQFSSRSVIIKGVPDNVDAREFINTLLSTNGFEELERLSSLSVDESGGYVVLLPSGIKSIAIRKLLFTKECTFQGRVHTVSLETCAEENIPEDWLCDASDFKSTTPESNQNTGNTDVNVNAGSNSEVDDITHLDKQSSKPSDKMSEQSPDGKPKEFPGRNHNAGLSPESNAPRVHLQSPSYRQQPVISNQHDIPQQNINSPGGTHRNVSPLNPDPYAGYHQLQQRPPMPVLQRPPPNIGRPPYNQGYDRPQMHQPPPYGAAFQGGNYNYNQQFPHPHYGMVMPQQGPQYQGPPSDWGVHRPPVMRPSFPQPFHPQIFPQNFGAPGSLQQLFPNLPGSQVHEVPRQQETHCSDYDPVLRNATTSAKTGNGTNITESNIPGVKDEGARIIEVTELPANTTEDALTMYFENTRRSGGGGVEKVELYKKKKMALIYFEGTDVVERVLKQDLHLINKQQVHVSLHVKKSTKEAAVTSPETSEEEQEVSCTTIEVKGFKPGTSDDTFEMYFENTRRSGGQYVTSIERNEDVIYVTFETPEEVRRVLEKTHEIDGRKLEVKLHIPKPCYKNRLLVTNVNNVTTKDALLNYLEARSRCDVTDIVYGDQPGIALVTFDSKTIPDLDKLKNECRKKPLQGRTIEISRVPIADSIVVQGLNPGVSEETITYYFESKRSGNKDGSDVTVTVDNEGHCFVTFEDYKVVDAVLSKRNHQIEGCVLTVSLYMECLGISPMEDDQSWYKQPEAFTVESLNKDKCRFLHQTKDQNLKGELAACFADITWLSDDTATLKCTLTEHTPDAVNKAKSWKETAEGCLTQYMNRISVEIVTPLSEIWDDVRSKLQTISVTTAEARVFVSDLEPKVVLVGYKTELSKLATEVNSVVKSVEGEYIKKKQEITETVTTLKPIQLRLLLAVGFPTQMMKDKKDLNVVIKLKPNEMIIKGQIQDITQCKLQMYEKINSFCFKDDTGFSEAQLSFLEHREVKDMIVNKMKTRHLYGVWDTESGTLSVLSTSDEDALSVTGLIREFVVEYTETLTPESAVLLRNEKWLRFLKEIMKEHADLVNIRSDPESNSVCIIAIQSIVHGIRAKVQTFIAENSIYSRILKIPKPIYRFLMTHGEKEIRKTNDRIVQYNGNITYNKEIPQIIIQGCKDGLEQAVKELLSIAKDVVHQRYSMNRAGIGRYIRSEKIKGAIAETEKSERCIIELQYNEAETVVVEGGTPQMPSATALPSGSSVLGATHFASCLIGHGRRIDVVLGDMTTMEVDVIVNAANNRLDHVGGLAKAIADKGGPAIQRESNEYMDKAKNKTLRAGDVVATGSGRLPCKMVVHAVGPIWSNGHKNEVQDLKDAVMGSMECADRKGHKSIVLPALSAGIFGYPVDLATKHIVEAIRTFYTLESPNSGLTNVYLVDVGRKSVDHFIAALQDVYYDKKVTLTAQNPDTTSRPNVAPKPKMNSRGNRTFMGHERKPAQDGSIKIELVTGEIAKQKSDVIVNSTANHLDLTNGAVSKSILRAAGESLQRELKKKYPSGIQPGDVAISSGGHLQCQEVYHACLTGWSHSQTESGNNLLQKLVETCLSLASKKGYTSIAFPALGTGNLGYPRDVVAQTMYGTVKDFQQRNKSLQKVLFVVYSGDRQTIEAFQNCERLVDTGNEYQAPRLSTRQPMTFQNQEDTREEMSFPDTSASSSADSCKIHLEKGEINKAKVDVIVNSTSENLDLNNGAVAKSLLKAGGDILQTELRTQYPNGIRPGEIAVTSGGKLQCAKVYHICLPSWTSQTHQNFLEDIIKKCLRKASDSGKRSIAFPALGTGNLGYPKDVVARTMYEAMADYQQRNKSIETVKIVIYHKDMPTIAAFDAYEKQRHSTGTVVQPSRRQRTFYEESPIREASPASVDLYFFSDDQKCISKGIQTLERKCDHELKSRSVNDPLIKKLTDKKIATLKNAFDVDLVVDKEKGLINITGLAAEVGEATIQVTNYLREIEKEEGESERASLLSRTVQWCYFENNALKDFDQKSNASIEKEFEGKNAKCVVELPKGNFKIDFSTMQGYYKGSLKKENIIRRDLFKEASASIFDPPKTWQQMADDVNFVHQDVANTDPEFVEVSQLFMKTVGVKAQVTNVRRIQNRSLFQQYTAKKKQLEKQNPSGTTNERRLWHGTSTDAIDSINIHGYNRSYCGKNATAYGQGVYFAVNAKYSASDTYSRPDANRNKYMYLAKVLTGVYVVGDSSMRTPPPKPGGKGAHDLCDSVVNDLNNPIMFIVFNDTQAYPEYLVTFKI